MDRWIMPFGPDKSMKNHKMNKESLRRRVEHVELKPSCLLCPQRLSEKMIGRNTSDKVLMIGRRVFTIFLVIGTHMSFSRHGNRILKKYKH